MTDGHPLAPGSSRAAGNEGTLLDALRDAERAAAIEAGMDSSAYDAELLALAARIQGAYPVDLEARDGRAAAGGRWRRATAASSAVAGRLAQ